METLTPNTLSATRFRNLAKSLVLLGVVCLGLMSLYRLIFLFRFGVRSDLQGFERDIFRAFVLGLRLDLEVVCYMTALPFLSLLAGVAIGNDGFWNFLRRAFRWYYVVMFLAISLVLAADLGYYSYFQDHLNVMIYGLWEDDTEQFFHTLRLNYNLPLAGLCAVAYIAVTWLIVRALTRPAIAPADRVNPPRPRQAVAPGVLLFVGLILGGRGGFGVFPLGLHDTAISQSQFVNQLSANAVLSLQKAIRLRSETRRGELDLVAKMGFKSPAQAFAAHYGVPEGSLNGRDPLSLMERRTPEDPAVAARRPNVVVILVEALGSHWMRFESDRFDLLGDLKTHLAQDLVFPRFLPSDNGTIGSLLSLVLNMPPRPMFPALTESEHMQTSFSSSAFLPYARNGYETLFIYGGQASWRDTNKFVARQGCEKVEGAADIEAHEKSPDGEPLSQAGIWKVYDEYLYSHIVRHLNDGPRPKFIVALTTTNHPPYSVPRHYRPRPLEAPPELAGRITGDPELVHERFVAYQYTCQELAEFLTAIKNSPLGANTIVAAVGDHNFWGVARYETGEVFEKYGVPLYLYVPPAWRPANVDTSVYGSHIDIMPTLYRLSLSDTPYIALGHDLLGDTPPPYAVNTAPLAVNRDGGMVESRPGTWRPDGTFAFDDAPDPSRAAAAAHYRSLLAVTDYYVKNQKQPQR